MRKEIHLKEKLTVCREKLALCVILLWHVFHSHLNYSWTCYSTKKVFLCVLFFRKPNTEKERNIKNKIKRNKKQK